MRKQVPVPKAPDWLARRCPTTCVLCGSPTAFACIYMPGPASPIAPPKPLVRAVAYGLCEQCGQDRSRLLTAIEAVIERQVLAAAATASRPGTQPTN